MWHNQSKTDDCKPSSLEWSKRSPVCLAQLPLFNIAQAHGLCKNCPCPINSIDVSLLRLFAFRHHEFSVQFPVTCSLWFLCFSAFVYCTPGDMEIAVWKLPRPSKFKHLSGNFYADLALSRATLEMSWHIGASMGMPQQGRLPQCHHKETDQSTEICIFFVEIAPAQIIQKCQTAIFTQISERLFF
mgnify:CR=1 FL=1